MVEAAEALEFHPLNLASSSGRPLLDQPIISSNVASVGPRKVPLPMKARIDLSAGLAGHRCTDHKPSMKALGLG